MGLLFDPRLVAYVNVLRDEKAQWDARVRRRADALAMAPAPTPAAGGVSVGPADGNSTNNAPVAATPAIPTNSAPVGFDPGNAYGPPHTEVGPAELSTTQKKLSDVAQCLIWVNTDCEIAALDQKYLRLKGKIDPVTREWHVENRAQLDALLQLAATGAQQGAAFANEAEVNPDVFAMILERASYLRLHGDDTNALSGLRQYWRCALLGNMCWQLAHTRKAAAVDLSAEPGRRQEGQGEDRRWLEIGRQDEDRIVWQNVVHQCGDREHRDECRRPRGDEHGGASGRDGTAGGCHQHGDRPRNERRAGACSRRGAIHQRSARGDARAGKAHRRRRDQCAAGCPRRHPSRVGRNAAARDHTDRHAARNPGDPFSFSRP